MKGWTDKAIAHHLGSTRAAVTQIRLQYAKRVCRLKGCKEDDVVEAQEREPKGRKPRHPLLGFDLDKTIALSKLGSGEYRTQMERYENKVLLNHKRDDTEHFNQALLIGAAVAGPTDEDELTATGWVAPAGYNEAGDPIGGGRRQPRAVMGNKRSRLDPLYDAENKGRTKRKPQMRRCVWKPAVFDGLTMVVKPEPVWVSAGARRDPPTLWTENDCPLPRRWVRTLRHVVWDVFGDCAVAVWCELCDLAKHKGLMHDLARKDKATKPKPWPKDWPKRPTPYWTVIIRPLDAVLADLAELANLGGGADAEVLRERGYGSDKDDRLFVEHDKETRDLTGSRMTSEVLTFGRTKYLKNPINYGRVQKRALDQFADGKGAPPCVLSEAGIRLIRRKLYGKALLPEL